MFHDEEEISQSHILGEKKKSEKNSYVEKIIFLIITLGIVSMILTILIAYVTPRTGNIEKYIEKNVTLNDIENIITRNGDLEAIKQAYSTQPRVSGYQRFINKVDRGIGAENYYDNNVTLSEVLSDLRVKAFREGNSDLVPVLNKIIKEYEHVDPFDKLHVGQKYYFENIRIKADTVYSDISSDINKIAEELQQQNTLVSEYLRDSELSFKISIFAVVLSLIFGLIQIYTTRRTAIKKLLFETLRDINSEKGQNDLSK